MPDNINDPRFWAEQIDEMMREFDDLIVEIVMSGATNGALLLPPGLQGLVNWDVVNDAVLNYLRTDGRLLFDQIVGTTRKQVMEDVAKWIESGRPFDDFLPEITKRLEEVVLSSSRAEMIAITEVTKAFAVGNVEAWRSTGFIQGKMWQTARDERVCPYCGALQGQIVELDAWFEIPDDRITPEMAAAQLAGHNELAYVYPPAHSRCRCWLQPWVDDEAALALIDQIIMAGLE